MIDKFHKLVDDGIAKLVPCLPKLASNRVKLPLWIHVIGAIVTAAALIPPVVAYRARTAQSREPRVHIFMDMDQQPKFKAQFSNALFIDGRAMRLPIEGTVARGKLRADDHYYRGRVEGDWAQGLPAQLTVNDALLARGQARFRIFCAPCHGLDGSGRGPVAQRAEGGNPDIGTAWTTPTNLHSTEGEVAPIRQPLGKIFNSITHGVRNMPAYGSQIPVEDRWAIVAYVKALQLSQNTQLEGR